MDSKNLKADDDICLIDSVTTHSILKSKSFFFQFRLGKTAVKIINGNAKCIEGSSKAVIFIPEWIKMAIENALFSSKARRNLLSFRDIKKNGYHFETSNEAEKEYLLITQTINGKKIVNEKLPSFSLGFYFTKISVAEIYFLVGLKPTGEFISWHERLEHPGSIMLR